MYCRIATSVVDTILFVRRPLIPALSVIDCWQKICTVAVFFWSSKGEEQLVSHASGVETRPVSTGVSAASGFDHATSSARFRLRRFCTRTRPPLSITSPRSPIEQIHDVKEKVRDWNQKFSRHMTSPPPTTISLWRQTDTVLRSKSEELFSRGFQPSRTPFLSNNHPPNLPPALRGEDLVDDCSD